MKPKSTLLTSTLVQSRRVNTRRAIDRTDYITVFERRMRSWIERHGVSKGFHGDAGPNTLFNFIRDGLKDRDFKHPTGEIVTKMVELASGAGDIHARLSFVEKAGAWLALVHQELMDELAEVKIPDQGEEKADEPPPDRTGRRTNPKRTRGGSKRSKLPRNPRTRR